MGREWLKNIYLQNTAALLVLPAGRGEGLSANDITTKRIELISKLALPTVGMLGAEMLFWIVKQICSGEWIIIKEFACDTRGIPALRGGGSSPATECRYWNDLQYLLILEACIPGKTLGWTSPSRVTGGICVLEGRLCRRRGWTGSCSKVSWS